MLGYLGFLGAGLGGTRGVGWVKTAGGLGWMELHGVGCLEWVDLDRRMVKWTRQSGLGACTG